MSVFSIYSDSEEGYFTIYDSEHPEDCTILSPHIQQGTNKAAGFDFTVLPGNEGYDSFHELSTFVYLYRDNKCIFRGRVSDVKTDIYKQRNVTCDGDLAILSDSIQAPNTFVDILTVGNTKKKQKKKTYKDGNVTMTAEQYFRSVIESHNAQMPDGRKQFTVGTVSASRRNETDTFSLTSYNDTSSIISSTILSKFGGIIRTRFVNDVAYIDWIESYSENNSQDVRFGVNLIELDEDQPDDDIWTVLLPIGNNGVTIESVNNGNKFLENANAIQKYGRIVRYHKFDTKKANDLLYKAQIYMGIYCKVYPKDIRVKAVDLELLGASNDPLELGDLVRVVSSPHGIDRRLACIEMDMDIFNPENNTYTIGSIMPPDEKEKTTLSSKSSSSKKAIKQASSYMSDGFDGFSQDLDTLGNNVNVNAENIAVNALNIAVNAENISVMAKNISVVADTIDIKARELTATFEDEIGDLQTVIQVTKEGLVATMTDNVNDMKGTLSATAQALTAGYEQKIRDEKGNITAEYTSLVELTAQGLTSNFDAKLYGDDGQGGIVADYKARISDTAQGLTREYDAKLYGEGGTADNPTGGIVNEYNSKLEVTGQALTSDYEQKIRDESGNITAAYTSSIQQTAQSLTVNFNTKLYGEGGTADDPTGGIVSEYDSKLQITSQNLTSDYEEKIRDESGKITTAYTSLVEQNARSLTSDFSEKLYGEGGTEDDPTGGVVSEYRSSFAQTAQEISSKVSMTDFNGNEIASRINQTATTILIQAQHINLDGYVTASELSTTNANITNLVNGNTVASKIVATSMKAVQGIEIGDSNNSATLKYRGYEYKDILINMPNVVNRLFLGYTTSGLSDTMNLAHSHTGSLSGHEITFGGTVATNADGRVVDIQHSHQVMVGSDGTITLGAMSSTGGSFRIADTKTYKDGVSAAAANVTVDSVRMTDDGISYDSTYNRYTVPVIGEASNGASKTSNIVFAATAAYNAGETAGRAAGASTVTINAINERRERLYNASTYGTTVFLQAVASNGATKDSDITVSGTAAYNAGNTAGVNSVTVGKPVERMDRVYSSSTHNTTIYIKAEASNGAYNTGDFTISGANAYSDGQTAGAAGVTVDTIIRTATATYNASTGNYTIPVKATASNNAYKEASLTISGSDAYQAGSNSVTISSVEFNSQTYTSSTNKYTINFKATASNNKTGNGSYTFEATGAYSKGYTAGSTDGAASVTVDSITQRLAASYNSSTKNYTVYTRATASNSATKNVDLTVSGSAAYNEGESAGRAAGASDVTITDITIASSNYDTTTNTPYGRIDLPITATASNGATLTETWHVRANAPYNAVTVDSVRLNGNLSYESTYNRYTVPVIGEASNGKTKTSNIQFVATDAYNAGKNSVTISSIGRNSSGSSYYNISNNKYTIALIATASNGNTGTADYTFTATSAYNNGYEDGHDDGYDEGYDDGYMVGYSNAEQSLDGDSVDVSRVETYADPDYIKASKQMRIHLEIYMTDNTTRKRDILVYADAAYNAGYTAGYNAGNSDGKTDVLNNFTVNDVYVYKVQNAYRADVRVHYGSNNYTRGNLTCVRGI